MILTAGESGVFFGSVFRQRFVCSACTVADIICCTVVRSIASIYYLGGILILSSIYWL